MRGNRPSAIICPYCDRPAEKVTGRELHPHRPDLHGKTFHHCAACFASVGFHPRTDQPLGTLAKVSTRRARRNAHLAFDRLWRYGLYGRAEAYVELAAALRIPRKKCHIGSFDKEQCEAVIVACRMLAENPRP